MKSFPVGRKNITQARSMDDLPRATRRYIERIEEIADVKVILVSVGAGRNETMLLQNPFW